MTDETESSCLSHIFSAYNIFQYKKPALDPHGDPLNPHGDKSKTKKFTSWEFDKKNGSSFYIKKNLNSNLHF